jgi:hypothetical protein
MSKRQRITTPRLQEAMGVPSEVVRKEIAALTDYFGERKLTLSTAKLLCEAFVYYLDDGPSDDELMKFVDKWSRTKGVRDNRRSYTVSTCHELCCAVCGKSLMHIHAGGLVFAPSTGWDGKETCDCLWRCCAGALPANQRHPVHLAYREVNIGSNEAHGHNAH